MRSTGTQIVRTPMVTLDPCAGRSVEDLENQQRVTSFPYYSTVRFRADRAADAAEPGTFLYQLNVGPRGARAFSYAQGEPMTPGGFLATDGVATAAETNLLDANQTNAGQYVEVRGMALQLHNAAFLADDGSHPPLDYWFLAALFRSLSVELSLNGEQTYKLGTMGMLPGAGGEFGGAPSQLGMPFLDGAQRFQFGSNGWPASGNLFHMPEGLIWRPQGKADSMLNVIFQQQRDIIIPSGGTTDNHPLADNQAAIANVSAGYNYPAQVICDVKVFLAAQVVGPRTRVS